MSDFEVCVFGSAMIDFISYVNRMPLAGETIHSQSFEIGYGGKGCNQAMAAARLGCKTAFVGKIGNDPYGKSYKKHFESEGINTEFFESAGEYTGIALIVVDAVDGNNQIVINGNANQSLSKQDVMRANDILKNSKILITQLEVPLEATIEALRSFQGLSILNAAPALDNLPEITFGLADIFCVNELEAEALTKIHFNEIKDAKEMVLNLQKRGCKTVIITLGKLGAVYNDEDGKIIHVPLPKKIQQINAVDSTGAGDAFIGGLAYFISKYPHAKILQKIGASIVVASYTVQFKGTQSSYKFNDDSLKADPSTEKFDYYEL